MKKSLFLDANDVKMILAEHFGVKPENVVKAQYSYTVITDDEHDDSNPMIKGDLPGCLF